jgi:glyoxylase-like metal-dependent hydrolase (beta-lactamase superfamily II)
MAVKEAMVCEIAKDTYAINEYGMSAMFLLIGSERAMLIDTGCGTLDIKAIVKELTDKPYDVVITHSHGDHIGGVPQFEEVYIHKNDMDTLFPINWIC